MYFILFSILKKIFNISILLSESLPMFASENIPYLTISVKIDMGLKLKIVPDS
jgi:hypothetical protein